jgi:hypothetical protein
VTRTEVVVMAKTPRRRREEPQPERKPSRSGLPAWFVTFELEAWTSRHLDVPVPGWFEQPYRETLSWYRGPNPPKPDPVGAWLDLCGRTRWGIARKQWLADKGLDWSDVRGMGAGRYDHLPSGSAHLSPPADWDPGPAPVRG